MRDQWNMPLWLGESGENSNEWFRDVVRFAEQANIGWSWWPWKKLKSVVGTVTVQEPTGYLAILNYWRGNGPRPTTNGAFDSLMQLAQAARFENCVTHPDVFDALMRPETQGATLPFKSNSIPGLLYAVDYDMGRSGEAFNDASTNNPYNSGSSYRNDSVDIEACNDSNPSIGYNVGWIEPGDWMKYTVPSVPPGPYSVSARVAAADSGGSFYLDVAGSNASGTINVPATGGWQSWTPLPARVFTNAQPMTSFKVIALTGGFNLNWLRIDSAVPAVPVGLSATVSNAQVTLAWSASDGATGYKVKRSITAGGPYQAIATGITNTIHTDPNLTNGLTYFYVVSAVGPFGESLDSVEASASIPPPILAVTRSASGVTLAWPVSASSFKLFGATNLAPPIIWLPVSNASVIADGVVTVSVLTDGGSHFFHLAAMK